MCLLAVACGVSERFPLAIAANRDERHERPALAIHWWHDRPQIFGGRDLAASGSWLAVDRHGRVAAVTNVRDGAPAAGHPARRSRGKLVADFLAGDRSAEAFAAALHQQGDDYGPFNLLLFDGEALVVTSNRRPRAVLERGVHALTNAPLDEEWPKAALARQGLAGALALAEPTDALLELLATRGASPAPDPRSSLFIAGDTFGTRSSAVILLDAAGRLTFAERRYGRDGVPEGDSRHEFSVRPTPPRMA